MASIVIDDVHKVFGALEVLHGVSLEVLDGEFVVLVGPSGCGKSTLLRMIAGLEDVTSGEIRIGDRVVNDLLPRDRDVAMVFQSYALYPLKNVFENMAFGLRMRKNAKALIDERVRETASTLELAEYLGRLPKELSGGQRQRVAMGRAIVRQPDAFLFDEPLSNLDARLRGQMRVEIKLRHDRLRVTSVYVTHDQVEAMTMADRIAVMRDGVIEQFGTPTELYDSPANIFVASFIGSPPINMISGAFRRQGGEAWVEAQGDLRLPVSGSIDAQEGQPVCFGIRPEAVTVGADANLTGKVTLIEMMGSHHQVRASVDGQPICVTMDRSNRIAAGDELPFSFDPRAAYVFDERSGRRLSNDGT